MTGIIIILTGIIAFSCKKEVLSMSRNLAIIGASYLQLPLIEKAKEMGYTTHVFAWAAGDVGEKAADHFYPISIVEKDEILSVCRSVNICGICSIASDLAMVTVNYVAEALGLFGNSMEATAKSTNKYLMRRAFAENGDPSPKSILVDQYTDLNALDLTYPVIVKPTDRSGSRGIFKLEYCAGLREAVSAAMNQGFEGKALIEEYAEGEEFSVEYISYRGEHHFLALTKKYTTGAPYFIETGHMEPALVTQEVYSRIKKIVPHALDSLGVQNGASHTELKITSDGTIRLIEIGGRMGGDCIGSDLVRYSTGLDYVRMVIDVACGNPPDFTPVQEPCHIAIKYVFCREDMEEFERLRREEPERIVRIVDKIEPEKFSGITDSSNRAGCYLYRL